jgi:circadian clock protein KaiC
MVRKTRGRQEEPASINKKDTRLLKRLEKKIKKEEKGGVKKPDVNMSFKSGNVLIKRPKGHLNEKGKFDFEKLKDSIEEKVKTPLSAAEKPERAPTGIRKLDVVMEGGFLRNSMNLLGGGSGTGKSIFSMQFIVNGIEKYGDAGVYVSFEESKEAVMRDMKSFGWNLEDKIKKKKLGFLHYTPEQVEKVLETGAGALRDVVENVGAKRLVIDSITAFLMLYETEHQRRKAFLKLLDTVSKWGLTTLIISEQEEYPEDHKSSSVEFGVDSVILVYNIKYGNMRQRAMEILKMRATKHITKIFPIVISDSGIKVFPEETMF